MNSFTTLFIIALLVSYTLQLWLSRRQVTYVKEHRDKVPAAFKDTIALEDHQKAADYTIDKGRLGRVDAVLGAIVLLTFTLGGGIEAVIGFWSGYDLSPLWNGIVIILSAFFLMYLVDIPISLYQTFVLEEKYGFNRSTLKQFISDQLLQMGLALVIGVPLLALILWIMNSVGTYWWLLAWAILLSFSILMSWAFPTFIAPLFNKFTPLADEELKKRIQSLLNRCGFNSKGVFVMDGSRRSGHGNAYFTGLGSNKRIVFFDTLIESLDHDELEAVLAHELGHFKRKHVLKMLAASAVMSLIGFGVLGWLIDQSWFYDGLGVSQHSNAAALLLFSMVSPVFTVFLQPVSAYFQRRYEFEADDFASQFADPAAMISGLVKLYRENANTLTPDPLYSAFHYSHPPAAIRIANLEDKLQT
ncbi:MAG: M48 family metallopeptidase [Methylococcales bacterium]